MSKSGGLKLKDGIMKFRSFDRQGFAPIHRASQNNDVALVEDLKRRNQYYSSNFDMPIISTDNVILEIKSEKTVSIAPKSTALHIAAIFDSVDVIKALGQGDQWVKLNVYDVSHNRLKDPQEKYLLSMKIQWQF